ncbi:hypothetical protein AAFG13_23665 [Bradyrhizobium sp. B124]|uniref:hypothetical protein n=1 Tax=Bradyrhizobium sp. B124 TaxID=3140245 RepID=UPI0031837891
MVQLRKARDNVAGFFICEATAASGAFIRILTLLVSWLVYRLVERPMIMFGRAIVFRHGVASRP